MSAVKGLPRDTGARAYHSPLREERARRTRHDILTAAQALFVERGFARVSVADIAVEAGVARATVLSVFTSKAALLRAVVDVAMAGDDEPVPIAERPAVQAIRDEPDVRRKITLFAEGLAQRQARSAAVQILIRDGRHVDDSLAPVWAALQREGLTGMTALGRHLLDTGQLREGLTIEQVRDILWNYLAIDAYERLVLIQGWSQQRYSNWLAHTMVSALQ